MQKYYIETHGCQMNEYDSGIMEGVAKNQLKLEQATNYEDADLVIINTCNIREKASEKLFSRLGTMARHKKTKLDSNSGYVVIIVTGCVAQAEGENIKKRCPFVDIVLGPQAYQNLGTLVNNVVQEANSKLQALPVEEVKTMRKINPSAIVGLDFETEEKFDFLLEELLDKNTIIKRGKPSEYITIQEGCNQFCTYCVVPFTRGPEFSRRVEDIVLETTKLRDLGTKEIVLLGQNVNAYNGLDSRGRQWSIAQLISKLAEIEGIERIRYTTSHPNSMTSDLIAIHGTEDKLSKSLNLPVQSGSTKVLKKMNRKYTREEYIDIINRLKQSQPNIVLSSDFIIGFPEETDEDHEQTISLVKTIVFQSQCFSFKYSPRPDTPATTMTQVDENIKSQRLSQLQAILEEQRRAFNSTFLGKTVTVLFDNLNAKLRSQASGRTEFNQIAIIRNLTEEQRGALYGQFKKAKVIEIYENSLICKIL